MKKILLTSASIFLLAIGLFGLISFVNIGAEKSGFVDVNYLFSNFKGTIELEQKFSKEQQSPQHLLDSLNLQIRQLQNKNADKSTIDLINETAVKKRRLSEVLAVQKQELNADYSQMIWDQINAYIKDFSEEYQYDYVFGLNGSGNVMYGNPQRNVTLNVLEYINAKYDGE